MSPSALLPFERHLIARGHQPSTVERYTSCVARLIAWSGVPADAVTSAHAYDYLVEQANRLKPSASWFNVIFVAVGHWFEMRAVPLELRGLKPQPRHRQPPRWLTGGHLRRLLQAVPDRRYRLAFQLVLATGVRVSELTALRLDDLDPESPLLRVRHGKGGDGRMVLVPPTLRERMRAYWRTFKPRALFFERHPGRDPRPLLNATLNEALGRAQVAAGLTEHVTMHRLRHSFAIHSLRAGMDIVTLQELMGHRCISSTIRYLTPDLRRPPGKPFDLLDGLGIDP